MFFSRLVSSGTVASYPWGPNRDRSTSHSSHAFLLDRVIFQAISLITYTRFSIKARPAILEPLTRMVASPGTRSGTRLSAGIRTPLPASHSRLFLLRQPLRLTSPAPQGAPAPRCARSRSRSLLGGPKAPFLTANTKEVPVGPLLYWLRRRDLNPRPSD